MNSPHEIKIFWSNEGSIGGDFTVIADGAISDHLCWDEMLGHIATLTLIGKPRYGGFTIGDRNEGRWWKPQPKLLSSGRI